MQFEARVITYRKERIDEGTTPTAEVMPEDNSATRLRSAITVISIALFSHIFCCRDPYDILFTKLQMYVVPGAAAALSVYFPSTSTILVLSVSCYGTIFLFHCHHHLSKNSHHLLLLSLYV